ncbi:SgrR family transcriptional regulator [Enterobacter soli]
MRTLLRQLTQSGWLSWSAQPGRGHRAIPALPGNHQRPQRTADARLPGKGRLSKRVAAGRR